MTWVVVVVGAEDQGWAYSLVAVAYGDCIRCYERRDRKDQETKEEVVSRKVALQVWHDEAFRLRRRKRGGARRQ